jgi:hypothetical protein
MPDWGEIIKGVGTFIEGASNVTVISQWLEMEERDALNSIEEFVRRSAVERIDSIDISLLQMAHIYIDSDARLKLIKFYAFFKLVETMRFNSWRGFPG